MGDPPAPAPVPTPVDPKPESAAKPAETLKVVSDAEAAPPLAAMGAAGIKLDAKQYVEVDSL